MAHRWCEDFGPFDGRVWLNCAHQGPLPRVAAAAAREAIDWKTAPHRLTGERFAEVPRRLRRLLGRLIGAPEDDIILANSASYGLHLLANGFPWRDGDEVLAMQGDFPSDILPWLGLAKSGVTLRLIEPRDRVVQPDELAAHTGAATRLFCMTWVHSFSGCAVDLEALGRVCRDNGVVFVANCSQAIGTRPLDVTRTPVDAVTCVGFKWLCGPYGTGFTWIRPEIRQRLDYNQAYWLSMQAADDLGREDREVRLRADLGARRYDVFGTANFFNFNAWAASVEYLLDQGIERIAAHNGRLVSRFIENLDRGAFELTSPAQGEARSTLIFVSHKRPDRNRNIYETLSREGVDVAYRAGKLRLAPHLYNTDACIGRALAVLNRG